jgi:hypothetical protein
MMSMKYLQALNLCVPVLRGEGRHGGDGGSADAAAQQLKQHVARTALQVPPAAGRCGRCPDCAEGLHRLSLQAAVDPQ